MGRLRYGGAVIVADLDQTTCPDRPRSENPEDLGFRPQRMVRWLGPRGLLSTGFRVLLAGIFGLYSDKREIEEVFPADEPSDFSFHREIWIDYIADLGDGFRPTYAMARVLAEERLELEGIPEPPQRGNLLVLGGDQVYPFATEDAYRNRLTGPFQAALPCVPAGQAPVIFAVPGNHDWYDGLTTFLRRFCQQRPIGGWETVQSRSYFAVKLPHRWWLWGIDIQFDFYIDEPQLRFFHKAGEALEDGDRIILCTAMPSWVHAAEERTPQAREKAARNLKFFESEVVRRHGGRLLLALSGDDHHYVRYETAEGAQQRISSGGGGAFLSPTHLLPSQFDWPEQDDEDGTRYRLARAYPDQSTSKRLRHGVPWAPFLNPTFGVLVGVLHLLFAWMIAFALRGPDLVEVMKEANYWKILTAMVRNPLSLLLALVLVLGLVGFAKAKPPRQWMKKFLLGLPHAGAHMGLIVFIFWVGAQLPLDGVWFWVGFGLAVFIGGFVAGSVAMGAYLWSAHTFGRTHATEAFSARHIIDYKSFVRMRIDPEGVLTLYPIKLESVPRKWRLRTDASPRDPWFDPVDRPIRAELIEEPVRIDPRLPPALRGGR